MTDLAMRILCMLPKGPIVATAEDIKSDLCADLGVDRAPLMTKALSEISQTYGLVRTKDRDGHRQYSLPAGTFAEATAAGAAWWETNK